MPFILNIRDNSGRLLDATFSVDRKHSTFVVNYESRGPKRNTQYAEGLELLLERMGTYPAVISEAFLTSKDTEHLSEYERKIEVKGYPFPLYPARIDIGAFRIAFGAAQGKIGRQPNATGSGNPTRRVTFILQLSGPNSRPANETQLAEHLVGPNERIRQYWAIAAHPDIYRLADATKQLEMDLITTKEKMIRAGDRLVMWQAKGKGTQRGIVALADVIDNPRLADDRDNPFWIDRAAADAVEPRARIRYVIPKSLPLWVGEPGNQFLRDLSVTKATGGTVFRLTPEQWTQIVAAAGGWEESIPIISPEESPASGSTSSRGQGRGLTLAERLAVENHAMARAKTYFTQLGVSVADVHATESCDLICHQAGQDVYVEVKGTISKGENVNLTFNEVELANLHYPNTALFVTSEIQLDRVQDPPVASGGRDRLIQPWHPSPESLKPLSYECSLGKDYGTDVTREATIAPTVATGGSAVGV